VGVNGNNYVLPPRKMAAVSLEPRGGNTSSLCYGVGTGGSSYSSGVIAVTAAATATSAGSGLVVVPAAEGGCWGPLRCACDCRRRGGA
jgi:hypothetical protein